MATLREYFDGDFGYAARVCVKLPAPADDIETVILYDFAAFTAFFACYLPGSGRSPEFFLRLLEAVRPGMQVALDGKIYLPSTRHFPGRLEVRNEHPFEMRAQFHGDPGWISSNEITASTRFFIYSESQLREDEITRLRETGRALGLQVQFRSISHAEARSTSEKPLAFISHDTRDKAAVARSIAIGLQRMMCPVWYDEFSLKIGDNLRDSIESGLRKCKKCIVVLSPHFFANNGWTKKEFDSIFTREILETTHVILPVWCGVTAKQVYEYCPSLANVKGVDWRLGEDEVCRQLSRAILDQER